MAYVQVPPDGSGKKVYSLSHTVDGNAVQVQGNHIVSKLDPSVALEMDSHGVLYTRYAEGSPLLGPYGDLKVLGEHVVGVYEHTIDSYDDLFYVFEQSGGTSTYENEYSSILMSVTEDAGSKVERITNRYHYYQIGTSMLIILTVVMGDEGKDGNVRKWGYANDDYGVLFELSGSTMVVVQRGLAQGSFTNRIIVPQSEWNGDKLDGTGDSGIILYVTKAYQYYINISWPFGKVEFGIYSPNSGRVKCHENVNDGVFTFPFIKFASLPVYYENINYYNTGTGSDMRVISAVVKAESEPDYTFWRFGDLGNGTGKTIPTGIETPILSVKPKILLDNGSRNIINSFPETLSVFSASAPIKIRLVWCDDDIFTGATWGLDSIDGPLLGDIDATAIDTEADSYWNQNTFHVGQNEATNIDLRDIFELNDEGILLSADGVTQPAMCFTAQTLNGVPTHIVMDLSYRGLY
jgi:hypothetical protein